MSSSRRKKTKPTAPISALKAPPLRAISVTPPPRDALLLPIVLFGIYTAMIILGAVVFRDSSVMMGGNEMSVPKAIFTSINAATLTGFRQSVALDQMLPRGQFCVMILMNAGAFLTLLISTLAVTRILRLRWTTLEIVVAALVAQFATMILGGICMMGGGRDFASAMFQANSAFTNCGLTLGTPTTANEPRTLFVLLPLSILGGLGLPVLMEIVSLPFQAGEKKISEHTRIVLWMSAFIFIIGMIVSIFAAWAPTLHDILDGILNTRLHGKHFIPLRDGLGTSLVATVNARGAGLPVQQVYSLPRELQWIMIALMAIGASSAGTGGGIKITTIFAIFRGGERALQKQNPGRLFGIALAWLGIYSGLVFVALLWLLQAQPEMSADRALFTVVSAASNVGLSHDPLPVNQHNAFVLSTTMLLGRILPMIVLWWTAITTDDADVAVG